MVIKSCSYFDKGRQRSSEFLYTCEICFASIHNYDVGIPLSLKLELAIPICFVGKGQPSSAEEVNGHHPLSLSVSLSIVVHVTMIIYICMAGHAHFPQVQRRTQKSSHLQRKLRALQLRRFLSPAMHPFITPGSKLSECNAHVTSSQPWSMLN